MDRVEFRSEPTLEGNKLSGIAHAFGQVAKVGTHYEAFAPGAFDAALAESDVRATMGHDLGKLLGRQGAGTLEVRSTAEGLAYSIDLPDTTYANDLRELVRRGDVTEMSFAFEPGRYAWSRSADGRQVRTHTSVARLQDVSPVAIPAFGGTSIQLRSAQFGESLRSQLARARARVRLTHL
jgi:HK97 family phage prohead protease